MRALIILVCIVTCQVTAFGADILYFTSSPTSWVGHGLTKWITSGGGFAFYGHRYFDQGAYTNAVAVGVSSNNEWWDLTLVSPGLTFPAPGQYDNAARWPFQDIAQPGLDFSGTGRGDNRLTGNFHVYEAAVDAGGNLLRFAADFEQFDEGVTNNWVRGSFRYHSDVPIPAPEPSAIVMMLLSCISLGMLGVRLRMRRTAT